MRLSNAAFAAAASLVVVGALTACSTPADTPAPIEEQKYDPRVLHREFSVREAEEVRAGAAIRAYEDRDVLFWQHHEGQTVVSEDESNASAKNSAKTKDEGKAASKTDAKKDASVYARKDASAYASKRRDASVYAKPKAK